MLFKHNVDIDVKFYNDRVKELITSDIIAEPFTYVPIRAGHMELVTGNSVVFGKITEGYDPISLDVETDIEYENISTETPRINLTVWKYMTAIQPSDYFWHEGVNADYYYVLRHGLVEILIPQQIIVGGIYTVRIQNETEGIDIAANHVAGVGDTSATIVDALEAALLAAGVDPADIEVGPYQSRLYIYGRDTSFIVDTNPGGIANPEVQTVDKIYEGWTFEAYIVDFGQLYSQKFAVLKNGATHSFGIAYKDNMGRRCSVLRHQELELYLPFYTETDGPEIDEIPKLTFKIGNKPPDWAESYEIVYSGNVSMENFLQIRIYEIGAIVGDTDRFTLNFFDTMSHTRNLNNRWKVPDWTWQDGDRIRLLGTIEAGTGVFTKYAIDDVYDYELEEKNVVSGDDIGAGEYLVVQATTRPAAFVGEVNIVAEIYRPLIGIGEKIYYGTGMVFEIGTNEFGYKYHKGDIDQSIGANNTLLAPAEIYNTANDCWKYLRLNYRGATADLQLFYAESNAPSDWWKVQTKLTSDGWPFLYDISQRQVALDERLRHGGKIIEGTEVNEIAHFRYDKFIDLPKKNGDITGIREIGYTLKVLQMYKETSIYIERIQQFSPDGNSQFTLISDLLGTQRPEETDYGCQHPESVMVNDRNLYYWDNSEGKFIRSAPNGQTAISDYKMKRWFKDLQTWINERGGGKSLSVYIGANVEHDEIWSCFKIGNEVTGAIFNEKRGRWITRIDQVTESYIHLGNWFAHMYQQKLYIMNVDEGQDWLAWAGVPTVGEVQFVSNINFLKNKVFNAIAVYADHQFQSLSRYIEIPREASSDLMETYIAVWDEREGVYYGKILKDQNSPGNFASMNVRTMNGREMRGRYCYFRLRTTEHDEKVRLDSVIVMSTNSERSA